MPPMSFNHLRPILWTDQIDETIRFYTEVLEFVCDEQNADWGWASLHRDGVAIMLAKPTEHAPFNGAKFTGSFYINVTDVEDLWATLKDKVNVCYPIESFDWGMREFCIYDNNGYLLQFGQNT